MSGRQLVQPFVRTAPILNLHVGERVIGTTAEHPFWVRGTGWTPAGCLKIGDELATLDGQWVTCNGVADSGRVVSVYNVEVEEDHTYFVGGDGACVWAHNAECLDINRPAQHGAPDHHAAMVNHAQNPALPPGVGVVEVRTNQALLNPNNPAGPALTTSIRPDVQVLGTNGRVYVTEINRVGNVGYHGPRQNNIANHLGQNFGGYNGVDIPNLP